MHALSHGGQKFGGAYSSSIGHTGGSIVLDFLKIHTRAMPEAMMDWDNAGCFTFEWAACSPETRHRALHSPLFPARDAL